MVLSALTTMNSVMVLLETPLVAYPTINGDFTTVTQMRNVQMYQVTIIVFVSRVSLVMDLNALITTNVVIWI